MDYLRYSHLLNIVNENIISKQHKYILNETINK